MNQVRFNGPQKENRKKSVSCNVFRSVSISMQHPSTFFEWTGPKLLSLSSVVGVTRFFDSKSVSSIDKAMILLHYMSLSSFPWMTSLVIPSSVTTLKTAAYNESSMFALKKTQLLPKTRLLVFSVTFLFSYSQNLFAAKDKFGHSPSVIMKFLNFEHSKSWKLTGSSFLFLPFFPKASDLRTIFPYFHIEIIFEFRVPSQQKTNYLQPLGAAQYNHCAQCSADYGNAKVSTVSGA